MEPEYIERKALDKALTAAAAHDKDKKPPHMGKGDLHFARSTGCRRCAGGALQGLCP